MFKKEIRETLKMFGISFLVGLVLLGFSYMVLLLVDTGDVLSIGEFFSPAAFMFLLYLALQAGATLFYREIGQGTFEYFFSLPRSRWSVLMVKMLPRFLALVVSFILYLLLMALIPGTTSLMNTGPFFLLIISFFLFSSSISLMYKKRQLSLVLSIALAMLMYMVMSLLVMCFDMVLGRSEIKWIVVAIYSVLGIILFAGFFLGFRRYDMNNMAVRSRRNFFRVMLPVLVLLTLFLLVNQFDSGAVTDGYKVSDFKPANFSKTNGFYIMSAMSEPPGVDIGSNETISKYRTYFDPGMGDNPLDNRRNREEYYRRFDKYNKVIPDDLDSLNPDTLNILEVLEKNRDGVELARGKLGFLLERYEMLLKSEVFEDFTPPRLAYYFVPRRPLVRVSRLYTAIHALDAVDGNWERGTAKLLENIHFYREAIRGSRTLPKAYVCRQNIRESLVMLNAVMNHPSCPAPVYRQVLDSLTPLKDNELSSPGGFICHYLKFEDYIKHEYPKRFERDPVIQTILSWHLFTRRNRTLRMMKEFTDHMIYLDLTLPYEWETGGKGNKNSRGLLMKEFTDHMVYLDSTLPYEWKTDRKGYESARGFLWWFYNSGGKMLFRRFNRNIRMLVYRPHQVHALYDMTRIIAEFHLKYDGTVEAGDFLKQLETYRQLDPFSGKSYGWNGEKGVIYSFNIDRKDGGGEFGRGTDRKDYGLPVRIKKK